MSLLSLPSDALLTILAYLHPSDITHLQAAFPPTSSPHTLTRDPHLWRHLYRRHFSQATGPHPRPMVTITVDGRLDWQTAYFEAERRRQAILQSKRPTKTATTKPKPTQTHPPTHSYTSRQYTTDDGQLRVEVRGNIRRIVSATAHRSSANVIWDSALAAARFDWTTPPTTRTTRSRDRSSSLMPRTDFATLRRNPSPQSSTNPPDTQRPTTHTDSDIHPET